jgi:hypothetical protein
VLEPVTQATASVAGTLGNTVQQVAGLAEPAVAPIKPIVTPSSSSGPVATAPATEPPVAGKATGRSVAQAGSDASAPVVENAAPPPTAARVATRAVTPADQWPVAGASASAVRSAPASLSPAAPGKFGPAPTFPMDPFQAPANAGGGTASVLAVAVSDFGQGVSGRGRIFHTKHVFAPLWRSFKPGTSPG